MRQWQFYQCPSVRLVFEELLFCANTKTGWFHGIEVKRGETVVSVQTLCDYTGYSVNIVNDALKRLVEGGEIQRERCWRGIKTKIVNFDKYQTSIIKTENLSINQSEILSENQSINEQEYNKEYKEEYIVVDARARERKILDELLSSRMTVETFCKSNGITVAEFQSLGEAVLADWEFTQPEHRSDSDIRKHLISTIRIKIRDTKRDKNGNNRTGSYQEQRTAELTKLASDYSTIIARRLAEDEARN